MNRLTFDPEEDQWKFQPLVPAERSVWVLDVGMLFPSEPSGAYNGFKNMLNFSHGARPFDLPALCVTHSFSLVSLLSFSTAIKSKILPLNRL